MTGGLIVPLLFLAFAAAVAKDWLGARDLVYAAVDLYFAAAGWIGEQLGASVGDAARRAVPSSPTPGP